MKLTFKKFGKVFTIVFFTIFIQGYWLTDKQVYQDNVAMFLASLIHDLHPNVVLVFIKTFYDNLLKNYRDIDKHRISKYYTLIRFFTQQTIVYLKNKKFEEKLMKEYSDMMSEVPLNSDRSLTDGL